MGLMATPEERLEELGRRIDILAASARRKTEEPPIGIQRRVAALREGEASARVVVHDAAASVEESLLHLDARVNLAERSSAADIAEDTATFLRAVTEELRGWDVYIERLQVKVATAAADGREQAEDAIRGLRLHRNALAARLTEASSTHGELSRAARKHVRAARDELESQVTKVEEGLGEGGDHVHGPRRHPRASS